LIDGLSDAFQVVAFDYEGGLVAGGGVVDGGADPPVRHAVPGVARFDDRAAQAQIRRSRLCFVGAADKITYGERRGGVHVSLAGPVINRRAELETLGWQVQVLEGLDHTQAMQAAHVPPILRPWLIGRLGR
jgi:hypothetical protein